ncbi:transporter [Chitinasiproducens palmae]|uniref:Transporter n=1 Tax=Chitinasiproducens palmae TaxID=1770053 RepID=A0A1H2PMX5_9BURK|nr:transporter [Chitinasiproducens palmae]SDV47952.1 hypothetical protein SAMN05216551_10427 [Chitinasiproducens palmae]
MTMHRYTPRDGTQQTPRHRQEGQGGGPRRAAAALAAAALVASPPAHAAHPLFTDDPGTQGNGGWQAEFNAERTSHQDDDGRQVLFGTTLTRGIGETVDVYATLPYTSTSAAPYGVGSGIGDTEVGAKWRFIDSGPFSVAVRAAAILPTGSTSRGLGNGQTGAVALLLGQFSQGPLTLLGSVGNTWAPNDQNNRSRIWQASAAVLYRIVPSVQLVANVGTTANEDRSADRAPAFAIVGAIWSPNKTVDLDVGYRRGLNRETYDHSLMAGLTLHW